MAQKTKRKKEWLAQVFQKFSHKWFFFFFCYSLNMACKLQNSHWTHIWCGKRIRAGVRKVHVPKATLLAVWKFVHHCGSIAGEAFKTIIRGLGGHRLPQTGGCSHTSSVHTLPSWTDTPALLLFRLWCSSNALTRGQADHSLQDCKSTTSPSFFPVSGVLLWEQETEQGISLYGLFPCPL